MGIYKVQDDGKAQKGLKAGDQVVTGGGTYKITGVNKDGSYKSEKVNDITTKTYTGGYANQGSSGNSQYTQGNYAIGSEYGKRQAQEMGVNSEWIATDGSRWVKENDGTITVYHGGTKTNNAWVPSNSSKWWEEDYMKENPKPTAPQKDPRIDRLLNEILNRDDFSYDVANDPLYQQYAKMYQREGDRAMKETLAEAAAGAGGMNTYAITAAQQANNYYNSQLNDRIPELYQLAYDMYLNDKESKIQDLGILQNMDATQYNRYRDTMSDWRDDRNFAFDLYQDEYNKYRNQITDNQWQQSFDFNKEQADISNSQWQQSFDFNKEQADISNSQWQQNFDYNVGRDNIGDSRYDTETATEMVKWLIQNGITSISPELIAQSRFSEADVSNAIATKQSQLANQGTSSGGGSGKGNGTSTGAGVIGVGANTPLSKSEVKSWADSLNRTVSDNYDGMQALKKTEDNRYKVADASLEFIIHRVYQSPDLTTEQKNYLLGQFGIDVTDEAVKDVMYTVATDPHYR